MATPTQKTTRASTESVPRELRLSIRTSAEQKELLKRAAQARGTDLSAFVLQASLEQARQALAQESVVVLSPSDYQQLCQALDEPATPNLALRALMNRKRVWDE